MLINEISTDEASSNGFVQVLTNFFQLTSAGNVGYLLDHFLVLTFIGSLLVLLWRLSCLLYCSIRTIALRRRLRRRFNHGSLEREPNPILQRLQQLQDENRSPDHQDDARAAGDGIGRDVDQDSGRSQIMVMFLQSHPNNPEEAGPENNLPSTRGIIVAQRILEELRSMRRPTPPINQDDSQTDLAESGNNNMPNTGTDNDVDVAPDTHESDPTAIMESNNNNDNILNPTASQENE